MTRLELFLTLLNIVIGVAGLALIGFPLLA